MHVQKGEQRKEKKRLGLTFEAVARFNLLLFPCVVVMVMLSSILATGVFSIENNREQTEKKNYFSSSLCRLSGFLFLLPMLPTATGLSLSLAIPFSPTPV